MYYLTVVCVFFHNEIFSKTGPQQAWRQLCWWAVKYPHTIDRKYTEVNGSQWDARISLSSNQIATVVSTHHRSSSLLAGEDRIHSIQQLSVMWEKNQCVHGKLLRSPCRHCRLNQRHCVAAGWPPKACQPASVRTLASFVMPRIVIIISLTLWDIIGVCMWSW